MKTLTLLQPVVALALWTLVMAGWMLVTRLPAMKRAGVALGELVGTSGVDAERGLPARAQWKAHNYNHLLEQPTLFYAVTIVLALAGAGDFATRMLAWSYVTLRVVHSVWQATVNRVAGRFVLFVLSTAALIALAVRAALLVF